LRALVVLVLLSAFSPAEAAPCQGYPASAAHTIKPRVEALRLIEREAADRLIGLDTRPFPYLAGQARAAADAIGESKALQDEDELGRCPNAIPHVRRLCAIAALALAALLEEQAAAAAAQASKRVYAQAVGICEGLVGLRPLQTAFRESE
jgi:hypothetical protein